MASIGLAGRPVLYSTNTWLAYNISERFYRGQHFVWCTPFFEAGSDTPRRYTVAPSSTPKEIYVELYRAAHRSDYNNSKIKDNKGGILKGAAFKRAAGVITEEQERKIAQAVEAAQLIEFRPLLYVIPCHLVAETMREARQEDRPANPLSAEYIIEALPNNYFDVIEFDWK